MRALPSARQMGHRSPCVAAAHALCRLWFFFFCFLARTFISLSRFALSASLVAVFLSIFAPPPYFVRLISGGGCSVCVALWLGERRLRHPSGAFGQVKFCGRWDSATTGFARQREMAQRPKPRPWCGRYKTTEFNRGVNFGAPLSLRIYPLHSTALHTECNGVS